MSRWVAVVALTGSILVGLYGIYVVGSLVSAPPLPDSPVCTADAMQCPDGSYVGRSGPDCEFVCPDASSTTPAPSKTTVETSIGKSVHTLDIDILPLEVTQDSRCPQGVECIWAGTVTLKTSVHSASGTNTIVLTLGTPASVAGKKITLNSVAPVAKQSVKLSPAEYLFAFEVSKQ
jgi:hypothetical protein